VLLAAHGSTNVEVAGARAVVPLRFSGTGPAPCRGRTGLDGQAEVLQQERHRHADYAAEAEKPWSRRRRFLGPASGGPPLRCAVTIRCLRCECAFIFRTMAPTVGAVAH